MRTKRYKASFSGSGRFKRIWTEPNQRSPALTVHAGKYSIIVWTCFHDFPSEITLARSFISQFSRLLRYMIVFMASHNLIGIYTSWLVSLSLSNIQSLSRFNFLVFRACVRCLIIERAWICLEPRKWLFLKKMQNKIKNHSGMYFTVMIIKTCYQIFWRTYLWLGCWNIFFFALERTYIYSANTTNINDEI